MVNVVVVCPGPEWEDVVQRPGELIPGMRIDCLEQPQHDPNVHGQNVQFTGDRAPENRTADGAEAKKQDFDWACILGGQAEGCLVLVMDFVDHLVESWGVEGTVRPEMPCVFHDKKDGDLVGHGEEGGEGNSGRKAAILSQRMEEPDLW